MRAAVARAAADCAVDDERAAAARAVGGGAADGAGRSALISGVQGSVRGNVQGTHDRTRLAMLLLLYYNILCSKSGVTYAKGLTGPNSCRVHNQTPQSSIKLLRQRETIYDQIDQMLSDWAQPPIRPRKGGPSAVSVCVNCTKQASSWPVIAADLCKGPNRAE